MSQTRLNTTAADAIRDRYGAFFANAFAAQFRYEQAQFRYEQMPGPEERIVCAAEFAAYRFRPLDDKLGRLIEVMEQETAASASPGQ